jgi:hypothetical protein
VTRFCTTSGTNTSKKAFKIKNSSVLFFFSLFLTKLFNSGHANNEWEGTSAYKNMETWARKSILASKKPINEIEIVVFLYNKGLMLHCILFTNFQDLKIIGE